MKEAAGEANITVITIVLIAIVLAVGTPLVRSLMRRTAMQSACTSAGGELNASGNSCIINGTGHTLTESNGTWTVN